MSRRFKPEFALGDWVTITHHMVRGGWDGYAGDGEPIQRRWERKPLDLDGRRKAVVVDADTETPGLLENVGLLSGWRIVRDIETVPDCRPDEPELTTIGSHRVYLVVLRGNERPKYCLAGDIKRVKA